MRFTRTRRFFVTQTGGPTVSWHSGPWAVKIDGATVWQTGGWHKKHQAVRGLQPVWIQTVSVIVSVCLSVCVSGAFACVQWVQKLNLPAQTVDFWPRGWRIQHSLKQWWKVHVLKKMNFFCTFRHLNVDYVCVWTYIEGDRNFLEILQHLQDTGLASQPAHTPRTFLDELRLQQIKWLKTMHMLTGDRATER